jgi:uncharacterized membrane protein
MNLRPFFIAAAVVVAAMLLLSAIAWAQLPGGAQVPIHWNLRGEVDGYASKEFALLFTPVLTAGLAALLAVVPRIEPRAVNLARSRGAFVTVGIALLGVLGLVHVAVVMAAIGRPLDIAVLLGIATGLMLAIIGNVLGKVRSNFMFGVRTPWTLASDLSWNKTHRLVGRLFVVLGLAVLVVGLVGGSVGLFVTLLGGLAIVLGVAFVYSYRVWRDDPDKQTIGRQPGA